jgi:hypothetical protein
MKYRLSKLSELVSGYILCSSCILRIVHHAISVALFSFIAVARLDSIFSRRLVALGAVPMSGSVGLTLGGATAVAPLRREVVVVLLEGLILWLIWFGIPCKSRHEVRRDDVRG